MQPTSALVRSTSAVALSLGLALPAFALDNDQFEHTMDAALSAEPYAMAYGWHTSGCAISPTTDLDLFSFVAQAGDDVRILIDGTSSDFDPKLDIYGPDNLLVSSNYCSGPWNGTCSLVVSSTDLASGTYTLVVSDAGADNSGNYVLQIERVPADYAVPVIPYDHTVTDVIGWTTDYDFFRFHGVENALMQFQLDGLSNDFDPVIEFIDPSGAVFDTASCSGPWNGTCSISKLVTLPATGTYQLLVRDAGTDNTGWYCLSATCIVACPTRASTTVRNGSGMNSACFAAGYPPVPGATWTASVNTNAHPGAVVTYVLAYESPSAGVSTAFGELLIDLGSSVICRCSAPIDADGVSRHAADVPDDLGLVGLAFSTQAAILGGGVRLCNAIDYVIGH